MSDDDFNFETHCVVCHEPRSTHPTETNRPNPLFTKGFACRDCDVFVTASRVPAMQPFTEILREFLSLSTALRQAQKRALELMDAEMTRLEKEQTAREEAGCPDCGYIEDDVATHYENCLHFDTDLIADDDEEEWS